MTLLHRIVIMVRSSEPNFQDMAEIKKKNTSKSAKAGDKQAAKPLTGQADKISKAAGDIFGKMKDHLEPKKVDAWQKKWLAVPANRKKYEKITDAPEVAGEELMAMANDIINFAQGEEAGSSHLFKKVKSGLGGLLKNPAKFIQDKAAEGKAMAEKTAKQAKSAAGDAKKKTTATAKSGKKVAMPKAGKSKK